MRSLVGAALVISLGLILFPWVGVIWIGALVGGGALAFKLSGRGGIRDWLALLDTLLFEGEKVIVAVSLFTMAFTVFVDVVWRTSHSVSGTAVYGWAIAFLGLSVLGGFTARWPGAKPAKRLGAGLGAFVVLVIACLVIHSAPNGFGWSQRLALVLLLWVGVLGGSMATHEGRHIAVDAVRKVVPARFKRGFEIAAGLVTTALCTLLATLGVGFSRNDYTDWLASGMRSFKFESVPIPYWAASVVIPIGFGLMAARFMSVTVTGEKEVDLLTSMGAGDLAKAEEEL